MPHLREQHFIDISTALDNETAHWPGDTPFRRETTMELARGDFANLSQLSMSAHTGTHMDAPAHFLEGGATIDSMPITATVGTARVLEITDPAAIHAEELERHHIQQGDRLLFKTRNSSRPERNRGFIEDFVSIAPDGAEYLASRRVRCVGIDYLSVGDYPGGGAETHRILLEAGIWIIEGLQLDHVVPGAYRLICLPLKLADADGAPARAVLQYLEQG
ncbi:MAG: cyclase family protein [Synergistales bacterium]|nr:cyclase family protein [Synergistales bacterium]